MMDRKLLILIGIIALCAFVGGILLGTGVPEEVPSSGGDLSPPPLPKDDQTLMGAPASDERGGDNISDLFASSGDVEPPLLPQ